MPLITFEGIDGCGKSTVIEACRKHLEGKHLVMATSDFEGQPALKSVMLSEANPLRQYFLILSARIFNIEILNRLDAFAGEPIAILYDRYLDSTLAYQGAMGVDPYRMMQDHKEMGLPIPDLTLVLDIPTGIARARRREARDPIEALPDSFFADVRTNFVSGPTTVTKRHKFVDATLPIDQVIAACIVHIESKLLFLQDDTAYEFNPTIHRREARL